MPLTTDEIRDAKAELDALRIARSRDVAACPIRYFTTEDRPSQTPFFYDRHPIIGISAGRRAGKTMAKTARGVIALTGIEPIALKGSLALLPKPPVRERVWCVDLVRMVKEVFLPMFTGLIPPAMLAQSGSQKTPGFDQATNTLNLTNGSRVQFMSYELRAGKGESTEQEIVDLDEIGPYEIYTSQKARLLTPRDFWSYMFIGGTRAGEAMPWDVQWFEEEVVKCGPKGKGGISHHEFSTQENLDAIADERGGANSEAYKDRQQQIANSWTDEERSVFVGGKSDYTGLTVYPKWSDVANIYSVPGVTAQVFPELARLGYGRVWCGMDHGEGAGVTVVVYVFVASKDVPEIDIAAGDYVQFAEYWRRNATIISHLPALQANQRASRPAGYLCDLHMWDKTAAAAGLSAAALYSRPKLLRDIVTAMHPDAEFDGFDLTPIGPLYRAKSEPGSVDSGIEAVSAVLLPRGGEQCWPRYRVLRGTSPYTIRGFHRWQRKRDPEQRIAGEKYAKRDKDQMDAVRYIITARPETIELLSEDDLQPGSADPYTGIALSQLCPLSDGIPGGLE